MSEDKIKRKIAWSATGICFMAFAGGYAAGALGLWFLIPMVLVVYLIVYNSLHL